MKGKKGAAHFEMIIAFVIFMGFVGFLFTIIKPYDTQVLTGSVIEGVFDSFKKETEVDFVKFFLRTEGTATSCHNATLLLELFSYELRNTKTFDLNGDSVNSNVDGEIIFLGDVPGYFYVYSSETFGDTSFVCDNDGVDLDPRIGSVTQKKVLSLSKLQEIEESYINDYEGTRVLLGVPEIYDFTIVSNDVSISLERERPETGDIIAKDFLAEVLDESEAKIINARFTLTVW